MTVYKQIENKVLKSKDGTLFFISSFPGYDEEYVGQVLSALCRQEVLVRIAFGIYLKPVLPRPDNSGTDEIRIYHHWFGKGHKDRKP